MASKFGKNLQVSIFGQSHGEAIGVVIDGLPPGEKIDQDRLAQLMKRRSSVGKVLATPRKEEDSVKIISGLVEDVTCGAPLCAVIENKQASSKDYENLQDTPRPSHSDYAAFMRYGGFNDIRGGGHFSGRLTAPLCVAGAIALEILERRGIVIGAHIHALGSVSGGAGGKDQSFHEEVVTKELLKKLSQEEMPLILSSAKSEMINCISEAQESGDSIGGIIECAIMGVEAGIGNPMFDGWENRLSVALFGIPAVKGVEFGSGFLGALSCGSVNNDPFTVENQEIKTKTNNHGGILGGISTGMPIVFRVGFKPTSSISVPQKSVNLSTGANVDLRIKGRHDPCIALRAPAVVEAVAAIVTLDMLMEGEGRIR